MNKANSRANENTLPEISQISGKDLQFKKDRDVRKVIDKLRLCQKAIDNFSDWLYSELDIPVNKPRRFVANLLNSLVPERFREYLPGTVAEFVAEETHASHFMESHLRQTVNNTQAVVRTLAAATKYEKDQLGLLCEAVETADRKGWDYKTIKEELVVLVNAGVAREEEKIIIDEGIDDLRSAKSDLLSQKEKDNRRTRLLQRIRNNIAGRNNLIEAKQGVLSIALEALEAGEFQLIDFLTVIRPLRTLEWSARNLAELDKSLYASKDVVIKMAQITAATIGSAADALAQVHAYTISGKDTADLFKAVSRHIQDRLSAFAETRDKLLELQDKQQPLLSLAQKKDIEDAEIIEPKPV